MRDLNTRPEDPGALGIVQAMQAWQKRANFWLDPECGGVIVEELTTEKWHRVASYDHLKANTTSQFQGDSTQCEKGSVTMIKYVPCGWVPLSPQGARRKLSLEPKHARKGWKAGHWCGAQAGVGRFGPRSSGVVTIAT